MAQSERNWRLDELRSRYVSGQIELEQFEASLPAVLEAPYADPVTDVLRDVYRTADARERQAAIAGRALEIMVDPR